MSKDDIKQKNWDSYFYPNTNVLINNLNIKNSDELKLKEKEIVFEQLMILHLNPYTGEFNSKYLCDIHRSIFDKIYPFAGEYRTCTLQKNSMFCEPEFIKEYLDDCILRMNNDINYIYSKDALAHFISEYYHELIYIHPFREGNGRSIRVFVRNFVLEKSKNMPFGQYDIDYTKMDKEQALLGTAYKYLYPSNLEMEFQKSLIPVEKKKIIH